MRSSALQFEKLISSARVRARIHELARWKASAGLWEAMLWKVLRLGVTLGLPEPAIWRVRPRQVRHPLQVRLRGSSDISVFDQVFLFQEYLCLRDLKDPSLVL